MELFSDMSDTGPDLAAPAAQIRTLMPIFERAMAIVGYPPPQQWTDLKTMTEPATITALQSTQHITDQWKHIRDSLNTNRNRLTPATATLPTAWNAETQQKTTDDANRLGRNIQTLENACDVVMYRLKMKHVDEVMLLLEAVAILASAAATVLIAMAMPEIPPAMLVGLGVTLIVAAYNWAVEEAGSNCEKLDWPSPDRPRPIH
ncbi:MAG TPA: hypothetical protein VHC49_23495 [Mycobacteriales bacterium]|nr:hypothetical protein [Mycobacteriales bacterium]